MQQLSLTVLGPPEVRLNGQLLTFATRKTLALLVYLVVEGSSRTRERLTDLFWPEGDAEHGRAALRRTLALLRQALPATNDFLLIERERLGVNRAASIEMDLRLVEAALRAGPARAAVAQLRAAADAYRGDFLDGFSLGDAPGFDDWVQLQREHWRRRMELVFDRLSRLYTERGATGAAIDVAARWVAHAPLDEAAHRRLMLCYLTAGNRTSALRAYEACRDLLRAELGVEPAAETEALAARLRTSEVPPAMPPRRQSARPRGIGLAGPLVGRGPEFGHLVDAYRAAARGRPHVVALVGEPGIGKTRLVEEFLSWAEAQGATVLHGRAFEAGDRLPYAPVIEALRRADLRSARRTLSRAWLADLSQLLPELREAHPKAQPAVRPTSPADDAAARTRLLDALALLTRALAEAAPLVLFVDDAHWADADSLALLQYLTRQWSAHGTPALLLLTLRGASSDSAQLELLAGIEREAPVTRLALSALTAEDTRQLVAALAADASDAEVEPFSRWLFDETAGQPFYIVETLNTLVEQGVLVRRRGGTRELTLDLQRSDETALREAMLPSGVQSLIRSRLARLTPTAQALLAAGAVLGRDFAFATACTVAGLGEDEGLAALDELRRGQLLREDAEGDSPDRIQIVHDKIREVVYADAAQARRRIFHRRALEALRSGAAPAAHLTHHALAAGLTEAAFDLSLAAGEDALRVSAVRGAIGHFEQARALAATLQTPLARRYELSLRLGRAYELEGEFARAREMYEGLLASARQASEAEAECVALNRLATLAAQGALDFEAALTLAREALAVAERSGATTSLAETEWNLAQIGYYLGERGSLAHGERAVAVARTLERPDLLARSLNTLAWAVADLRGDGASALAYAHEARDLYASLGDRTMEADCLCLLAAVHVALGDPREAKTLAQAAQSLSAESGNMWGRAHSAFQMAKAALDLGSYARALALADEGTALAQEHGLPMLRLLCLALRGAAQRSIGMLDAAVETHQEAAALAAAAGHSARQFVVLLDMELAADRAAAGDWPSVGAEVVPLDDTVLDRYPPFNLLRAFVPLVETLLRAGEHDLAARLIRRVGAYADGNRRTRIAFLRGRAAQAHWEGEVALAIASLEEAAVLADALDLPDERWQINAALGALYREQGDEPRAQAARSRAADIVRSLVAGLNDESQRRAFLAQQPIRALLDEQ